MPLIKWITAFWISNLSPATYKAVAAKLWNCFLCSGSSGSAASRQALPTCLLDGEMLLSAGRRSPRQAFTIVSTCAGSCLQVNPSELQVIVLFRKLPVATPPCCGGPLRGPRLIIIFASKTVSSQPASARRATARKSSPWMTTKIL